VRDVTTDATVFGLVTQTAGSGLGGRNLQVINVGSVNNASVRDARTSVLVIGAVSQIGAAAGSENVQRINLGGIEGR
jgi:hypothetical protein